MVLLVLASVLAMAEQDALRNSPQYAELMAVATLAVLGITVYNSTRARSAVLYFDEQPPEILTKLGLMAVSSAERDYGKSSVAIPEAANSTRRASRE